MAERPAAPAHWAFQPVRPAAPPAVKDRGWVAHAGRRLHPGPAGGGGARPVAAGRQADPDPPRDVRPDRACRRRPTEVEAFEADASPDAFARVVDRLLASPRYGERWGRHWLDVARYADTKGYVFTAGAALSLRLHLSRLRHPAFNDDLPYDRFVVEQLAADQLAAGDDTRPLAAHGVPDGRPPVPATTRTRSSTTGSTSSAAACWA